MLANFYTKILQGALFRKFRDVIMGLQHISTLKVQTTPADQERVGNNVTLESNNSKPGQINESTGTGANIPPVRREENNIGDVSSTKILDGSGVSSTKMHDGIVAAHDVLGSIPVHRKSYAEIVVS